MVHPEGEQLADDALGVVFFFGEGWAEVEIFVEEVLALLAFGLEYGAEGGQAIGMMANVVESLNFGLLQTGVRVGDEVSDEAVEDALQGFVEFQLVGGVGVD